MVGLSSFCALNLVPVQVGIRRQKTMFTKSDFMSVVMGTVWDSQRLYCTSSLVVRMSVETSGHCIGFCQYMFIAPRFHV